MRTLGVGGPRSCRGPCTPSQGASGVSRRPRRRKGPWPSPAAPPGVLPRRETRGGRGEAGRVPWVVAWRVGRPSPNHALELTAHSGHPWSAGVCPCGPQLTAGVGRLRRQPRMTKRSGATWNGVKHLVGFTPEEGRDDARGARDSHLRSRFRCSRLSPHAQNGSR